MCRPCQCKSVYLSQASQIHLQIKLDANSFCKIANLFKPQHFWSEKRVKVYCNDIEIRWLINVWLNRGVAGQGGLGVRTPRALARLTCTWDWCKSGVFWGDTPSPFDRLLFVYWAHCYLFSHFTTWFHPTMTGVELGVRTLHSSSACAKCRST